MHELAQRRSATSVVACDLEQCRPRKLGHRPYEDVHLLARKQLAEIEHAARAALRALLRRVQARELVQIDRVRHHGDPLARD